MINHKHKKRRRSSKRYTRYRRRRGYYSAAGDFNGSIREAEPQNQLAQRFREFRKSGRIHIAHTLIVSAISRHNEAENNRRKAGGKAVKRISRGVGDFHKRINYGAHN